MKDACVVRGAEPGADGARDARDLGERHLLREQIRERAPLDELHRDELAILVIADVVRPEDVRMRHAARELHLAPQHLDLLARPREARLEDLDCDLLVELDVVREIDVPHPAAAQHAEDVVALADDGQVVAEGERRWPGGERRVLGRRSLQGGSPDPRRERPRPYFSIL